MRKILIGKILKPKGLDGTLKVTNFELEDLAKNFKNVFIDEISFKVQKAYTAKDFVYYTLETIDSIDKADKLRNKEIFGSYGDLNLPENKYLTLDIIGCSVIVAGKKIGVITSVENYGAGDIYSIEGVYGIIMVSNIDGLVIEVDIKQKRIEFDEKIFNEVKV